MLSKRVVACLDVKNGELSKGVQFVATEMLGDRAFCVAVQEYAKNGGCVVVHGEGTALCLFLGNVLGQGWAANARGYREEDW